MSITAIKPELVPAPCDCYGHPEPLRTTFAPPWLSTCGYAHWKYGTTYHDGVKISAEAANNNKMNTRWFIDDIEVTHAEAHDALFPNGHRTAGNCDVGSCAKAAKP
ncbi:hypothetical protein [Streptomyces sp. CC53]|uniref:hypothetical protein n=1 Tax=Streptomyces sp. CC53 TaxID=1906740 RepID=UPI00115FA4C1|nr:hypothetical protein [Streptomyces sp. CC53]